MIAGIVNADFEAIISLSVCDSEGKIYTQDAIIDTGFNGWLSLTTKLNQFAKSEMEKTGTRYSW
jgi:predicted aspartyl protease